MVKEEVYLLCINNDYLGGRMESLNNNSVYFGFREPGESYGYFINNTFYWKERFIEVKKTRLVKILYG